MAESIVLPLFESAHEGFGDAIKVRDNRYHRIHGSIDARTPGQIKRGMSVTRESLTVPPAVGIATGLAYPPSFVVEWTFNGLPIVYIVGHDSIWSYQNATFTLVGFLDALVSDGMLDDNGSGIAYLYVANNVSLRRMTIGQAITSSSPIVEADKLLSLNGYAYRSITPLGGSANCQISVCPPGSDRFTSSNWGAGVVVGIPSTSTNAIIGVRQAAVAIKPEGIYGYSQSLDEWVAYASWAGFAHTDNGKGARSFGDLALIPMGDGGLVLFDGYTARSADPISVSGGATPSVHTTPIKIATVGATRHWAVAVTGIDAKVVVPDDLVFLVESPSSTFTDYSTDVKSSSYNTTADISTIGDAAARYIWIGSAFPFSAIKYTGQAGQYSTTQRTLEVSVGWADGSYALTQTYDFTDFGGNGTFGQDGIIMFRQDPIEQGDWVPTTVNGQLLYWARLAVTGSLSTATRWTFCQVAPRYPSVDYSRFPLDSPDRSGLLPHILLGDIASLQSDTPIWHDFATLESDAIGALLVSSPGGTNSASNRNLYAFGRRAIHKIELGPDKLTSDVSGAPVINGNGLYEAGAIRITDKSDARLVSLYVDGFGFERASADPFNFYYSWDDGEPWNVIHMGSGAIPPITVRRNDLSGGRMFRWAIGWQGTSGILTSQAVITKVEATFMPTPGHSISRVRTTPTRI